MATCRLELRLRFEHDDISSSNITIVEMLHAYIQQRMDGSAPVDIRGDAYVYRHPKGCIVATYDET